MYSYIFKIFSDNTCQITVAEGRVSHQLRRAAQYITSMFYSLSLLWVLNCSVDIDIHVY